MGIAEGRLGSGEVFYSSGPTIIDSFENGDLSRYSHNTGAFAVNSGPSDGPVDSSFTLEHTDTGYDRVVSTSGLTNYPQPDQPFRVYIYGMASSSQHGSCSACKTRRPTTATRCVLNQDDAVIQRWDNGSVALTLDSNYSIGANYPGGEWWYVDIDWTSGGSITADLHDASDNLVISLSGSDSTYGAGESCFRAYQGGSAGGIYFDYAYLL